MRFLQSYWFPLMLGAATLVMSTKDLYSGKAFVRKEEAIDKLFDENSEWVAPSEDEIPNDEQGDLIRYGKDLIVNTAKYLGPRGIVAQKSNGMNCQNCHLNAGRENFANPFSAVSSTYPKFRDRSGRVESIEFRINECMQRSLDGETLDSTDLEMRAMVAYLKWISAGVPTNLKPKGSATEELPFLDRAASPLKGKLVYVNKCQRCHGEQGQGLLSADSVSYTYPPLWGNNSFNVSAGLYRLTRLAGFIKNNMPFGATKNAPELTNEEAWDVAAFVASQPRPQKFFSYDWPNIARKPIDYPFGPFADPFPEQQHKYGPFLPIKKVAAKLGK